MLTNDSLYYDSQGNMMMFSFSLLEDLKLISLKKGIEKGTDIPDFSPFYHSELSYLLKSIATSQYTENYELVAPEIYRKYKFLFDKNNHYSNI